MKVTSCRYMKRFVTDVTGGISRSSFISRSRVGGWLGADKKNEMTVAAGFYVITVFRGLDSKLCRARPSSYVSFK